YPDFVVPVAREVSKDPENTRGIILGATGEGEAITANKFPHVRAVVYYGVGHCVVDDEADVIERSRQHNNANVLSLAARYLTEDDMVEAVTKWLTTPFSQGERHIRRLGKIDHIDVTK
ncbi:MAG: RpiB/LacA/LacB family sugar-phosphate isomerase, partial [Patescibacteria group bacterium]